MLFNSIDFIIFFTIVYSLYLLFNHRWQNWLLLGASYIFYGYWDYRFLALIFASTVLDYFIGQALINTDNQQRRKLLLTLSLVFNLGLLGFFKYYNFFIESAAVIVSNLGLNPSTLNIILPVGISFYTFQTMSYTVDIYRGRLKPIKNFFDFALFVSFFPQLVAGPIERAVNLLPQVTNPRKIRSDQIYEGLYLTFWGLFKKMFIADNLAVLVDYVFSNYTTLSGAEIALGIIAFAFQIYGDFSGYTDTARGISKLFGFELMLNFNLPYFATNPSDFWRRWHISLSSWLRDYLYIPLGGNRHGTWQTYRNLMLTMVLGGLWHGAAWTFVLWGFYQGLLLIIYQLTTPFITSFTSFKVAWAKSLNKFISIVVMFIFICMGWLIFRATSVEQIFVMLARIVTDFAPTNSTYIRFLLYFAYFVTPLFVIQLIQYFKNDGLIILKFHPIFRGAIYFAILSLFLSSGVTGGQTFIYFQF